jgi:integrase-like protein
MRAPRLRLLHRSHCHFSTAVRLCHPRHRLTPNRALESHRPSHGRMDNPAVSQRPSSGWRVSLSRPRSRRHLRASLGRGPSVDVAPGAQDADTCAEANAYCERFIGTVRRECLDWVIPLNERHLRRTLAEWIPHYNRERPHSALGPGLSNQPPAPTILTGHQLPPTHRVVARASLGGLHHHYELEPIAPGVFADHKYVRED